MQIGLDAWCPEDAAYFADLGVTWTKLAASPDGDMESVDAEVFGAKAAGLNVVLDLRPPSDAAEDLFSLRMTPDPKKLDAVTGRIADACGALVDRYKDSLSAVEFWGEFACPVVGAVFYEKSAEGRNMYRGLLQYAPFLQRVHDACKAAAPDVAVWNGGAGVNHEYEWFLPIAQDAPNAFDAVNLHQYLISDYWPRKANGDYDYATEPHKAVHHTVQAFARQFDALKTVMADNSCARPLVSSEWGVPTVADAYVQDLRAVGLDSAVFENGVTGLGETEAVPYLDAWLSLFQEVGFEVLIVHRLHDDPPVHNIRHWGKYCGLLFMDYAPKAVYDVIRRWAWRCNHGTTPPATDFAQDAYRARNAPEPPAPPTENSIAFATPAEGETWQDVCEDACEPLPEDDTFTGVTLEEPGEETKTCGN